MQHESRTHLPNIANAGKKTRNSRIFLLFMRSALLAQGLRMRFDMTHTQHE
jgi:hypothetical protein